MRRNSIAVALVAGLTLCGGSAWADGGTSSAEERQVQAGKHADAGTAYYVKKEYGRAIVEFMKGHTLMPNALFLYNISLSHVQLGNVEEALEKALEARELGGLGDRTTSQNEGRIASLRRILMAREVAGSVSSASVAAASSSSVSDPSADGESKAAKVEPSEGMSATTWVGTGFLVAGVGLLGGAGMIELGLQDTWDEYEQAGAQGDDVRYVELFDEIEGKQEMGKILLFSGLGCAAIGSTLLVVDVLSGGESEDGASASVVVWPGRDGAQVGVSGSF